MEAWYNRGLIYLDFTNAIDLNPRYTEAYYNRGIVYDKKGQRALAKKDYQAAATLGFPYMHPLAFTRLICVFSY